MSADHAELPFQPERMRDVTAQGVALDDVLITGELSRRASRSPDYEAESRALANLMDALVEHPRSRSASDAGGSSRVLEALAETALRLCSAHSCGISILEQEDGGSVFRWRAVAGAWAGYRDGEMPREASPSGVVVARNAPLLMALPERHFIAARSFDLPIVEVLLVPFHRAGEPIGTIWIVAHDGSRQFESEDVRLLTSLARCASLAHQLLDDRHRLSRELAAMEHIHTISALMSSEGDIEVLAGHFLDAILAITSASFASMQMLHGEREADAVLRLIAHRGFDDMAVSQWESVGPRTSTPCGTALRTQRRTIVPDVEACASLAGTESLEAFRRLGIRAVQTTPLFSRAGAMLGAISTHWRHAHHPSERDLRLIDVLARQAASLLERARAERSLRELNAELEAQDRRKDLFLATLGHELRNPLSALDLGLQLMERGADRERVEGLLARNVHQLKMIVNDLLEVARITRAKIELHKESTDLTHVVRAAVGVWRPAAEQKQQNLVADIPEQLIAEVDPTRLEQVVTNLIANAVKYTPEGGHILVRVASEREDVILTVTDDGKGIRAEDMRAIFEPFAQVDPETGGLGIGLPLARGLVELHGGALSVESEGEGRGSTFRARIPRGRPVSVAPPPLRTRAGLPASLRVVVVDDLRDYADSQAFLLRGLGCEATALYAGEELLDRIDELQPHVVLLDLGLPGRSGFEVARQLRSRGMPPRTWLIAVSGFGDRAGQQKAAAAGFDQRLTKPVAADVLEKLLLERIRQGL